MTVREWRYEDILAVTELEKKCFSDAWNYKAYADSFLSGTFRGVLAEEGEKLVGYGFVSCVYEVADLNRIAVCPDARGKGVGSRVLCALESMAREMGVERIMLEVRQSNAAAIGLYEKAGFTRISERKKYYGDGETALIYQKII